MHLPSCPVWPNGPTGLYAAELPAVHTQTCEQHTCILKRKVRLISTNSPLDFLAAFAIVLFAGALLGIGLAWGRTGAAFKTDGAHA